MKTFYSTDIREEELKLKVAKDWFSVYDTTKILGSIDFCVSLPANNSLFKDEIYSLVWGEAKAGNNKNIFHSFVQLILTIGKAKTFDKHLPPQYLAAFDCEKFAFIPYHAIQDIFYQNDFNWNVTPSDHHSKEFLQLIDLVEKTIKANTYIYNYDKEGKELRSFIKHNLSSGTQKTKLHKVNKNNFTFVYQRWCEDVKKSIQIDWEKVKKVGLLDADFFLADLLSKDGNYLLDSLFVLLSHNHYQFDRKIDPNGIFTLSKAEFKDDMVAHKTFWNKYERPPKREYWEYIVERRDLLVPQDIRERRGSFFTPQKWVQLSQEYIEMALGEDWQDNYYIWDCCAGTGNLLVGLTNQRNIWASTLDKADVDVIHERIKNGAKLFKNHVFQFDFLNDEFSKLPKELQEIINNEEKRRKLVVFINPPYAETANKHVFEEDRKNKRGVSFTKIQEKYAEKIGIATKELFAQFFIRCKKEITGSILAHFSKVKFIQGPNFEKFRKHFTADYICGFVVPANTFDNVKGKFPIGFMIWNLGSNRTIGNISCDVYDRDSNYIGQKELFPSNSKSFITDWLRPFHTRKDSKDNIGSIGLYGSDFQHANFIYITRPEQHTNRWTYITKNNLIPTTMYLTIRHVIEPTWLNDRDQFLFPKETWENDKLFQLDCLIYALFHYQNRITCMTTVSGKKVCTSNDWIPFTEQELCINEGFASHFMQDYLRDFMAGKVSVEPEATGLFKNGGLPNDNETTPPNSGIIKSSVATSVIMSEEATNVMNVGREIWRYYFQIRNKKGGGSVNASLYDIKYYFKGENAKGNMNATSTDEKFNELMNELRNALLKLGVRIAEKVYEHGFLVE